jgi:hypothetical protein
MGFDVRRSPFDVEEIGYVQERMSGGVLEFDTAQWFIRAVVDIYTPSP